MTDKFLTEEISKILMNTALNTGSFFLQEKSSHTLHRHLYEIYNDQHDVFKLYYVYESVVKELYITAHDSFKGFDCKFQLSCLL